MASNINPYNIDGTFPIANQDNPSQGFRDNFTNIKNNFVFAQNELDDLQSKVLLTGALNGQTLTNDMAGTQIRRPQLASWTQSAVDLGAIAGASVLDFSLANFQKLTSAGSISLSFVNWPASYGAGAVGYGLMRVWIYVTDIAHTLTTPTSVSIGIADLADSMPNGDGTYTIKFDAPGNYIFDFSSINSGADYQIFDLSRNRSTFRDPDLYFNAEVNSTFLIGYGAAALPVALELEQGADKVSVQGSYNSVSAGTDYTGNIALTQGDNGPSAGYSVSGLRGNLAIGEINSIQNNDFVGYYNALTFTGDGNGGVTPNTIASIGFYARGTDPANGLGGNITLWTTPDGTGSTPFVAQKQAIGIENDQSVQFFGNVTIAGNLNVANVTYTNSEVVTTTEIITGNITSGNIIPSANVTYSLGSATQQWKDLWVSNNTIHIGNVPLSVSNGQLLVNNAPIKSSNYTVQYLVVGGGGGGGAGTTGGMGFGYPGYWNQPGGGGGAGGVVIGITEFISGLSYVINIGTGGRGGNISIDSTGNGLSGNVTYIAEPTTFANVVAYGGGGGGGAVYAGGGSPGYFQAGGSGASGGGGGSVWNGGSGGMATPGSAGLANNYFITYNFGKQGTDGSAGTGGGNGGGNGGGVNAVLSIGNVTATFGTGGGYVSGEGNGTAGITNTGSGGQGGSGFASSTHGSGTGGKGADGVVYITYYSPTQLGTGGNVWSYTNNGHTYWMHRFTSNGTYTA